jgi:hypothetical protein
MLKTEREIEVTVNRLELYIRLLKIERMVESSQYEGILDAGVGKSVA